jgi:hypothetical protein
LACRRNVCYPFGDQTWLVCLYVSMNSTTIVTILRYAKYLVHHLTVQMVHYPRKPSLLATVAASHDVSSVTKLGCPDPGGNWQFAIANLVWCSHDNCLVILVSQHFTTQSASMNKIRFVFSPLEALVYPFIATVFYRTKWFFSLFYPTSSRSSIKPNYYFFYTLNTIIIHITHAFPNR